MRKPMTLSPWGSPSLFPSFDQLFNQLASLPRQESDSWTPAIDSGKGVGGEIPAHDFNKRKRPQGAGVDRGAFEVVK